MTAARIVGDHKVVRLHAHDSTLDVQPSGRPLFASVRPRHRRGLGRGRASGCVSVMSVLVGLAHALG